MTHSKLSKIIFIIILGCILFGCDAREDEIVLDKILSQQRVAQLNLHGIKEIQFDENDNIYILDNFERKIHVFNSSFQLIRIIGGIGSGPGEFNSSLDDFKLSSGKLYVLDRNGCIYVITQDAREIERIYLDQMNGNMLGGANLEVHSSDQEFWVGGMLNLRSNNPEKILGAIYDNKGKLKQTFKIKSSEIELQGIYSRVFMNKIDDKVVFTIDFSDKMFVFDLRGNLISVEQMDVLYFKPQEENNGTIRGQKVPINGFEKIANDNYGLFLSGIENKYHTVLVYDNNLKFVSKLRLAKQNEIMPLGLTGKYKDSKFYLWEMYKQSGNIYLIDY